MTFYMVKRKNSFTLPSQNNNQEAYLKLQKILVIPSVKQGREMCM
jgi:hypothetical protein